VRRTIAAVVLAAALTGCGASNIVSPVDVAQNYATAVGAGNDQGACALLEPNLRASLVASAGSHLTCPALLARCLPSRSTATSGDNLQLLYVNVDLRTHGPRAVASLSGLPVARAIKQVTMVQHRTQWRLTSPGRAITRCVSRLRRDRRRHRRGSAGG
jgi:hypothetical protein